HACFRVAQPGSDPLWRDRIEPVQVLPRQVDLDCRDVLREALEAARAGDWNDVPPPGEHPGQCELGRRAPPLLLRHLTNRIDQLEVLFEVLALEAREAAPRVVRGQVVDAADRAGQETAPQRA